jgi:hypothetical protein
MRTVTTASALIALVIAGCTPAGKSHAVSTPTAQSPAEPTAISIHAPLDKTWRAVEALIAERSWPIATTDRASGSIATGWLEVPATYASCSGAPPLSRVRDVLATEVRFDVLLHPDGAGTRFSVDATFRQVRSLARHGRRRGNVDVVGCASSGLIESVLRAEVAARASAGAPPSLDRRGATDSVPAVDAVEAVATARSTGHA